MRYGIEGGWVVQDHITSHSDGTGNIGGAQAAVAEWNARCVTRQVDPPVKVDGWVPAGELRVWLLADDGWWARVASRTGVRWIRANHLRQSRPSSHII